MVKGLSRISLSSPPKLFTPETQRQRSKASEHKGNAQLLLKIKLADAMMKGPGKPFDLYIQKAFSSHMYLNIYSYSPPVLSLRSFKIVVFYARYRKPNGTGTASHCSQLSFCTSVLLGLEHPCLSDFCHGCTSG